MRSLAIDSDPFALAVNSPSRFQAVFNADADSYLRKLGFGPAELRRNAVALVTTGKLSTPVRPAAARPAPGKRTDIPAAAAPALTVTRKANGRTRTSERPAAAVEPSPAAVQTVPAPVSHVTGPAPAITVPAEMYCAWQGRLQDLRNAVAVLRAAVARRGLWMNVIITVESTSTRLEVRQGNAADYLCVDLPGACGGIGRAVLAQPRELMAQLEAMGKADTDCGITIDRTEPRPVCTVASAAARIDLSSAVDVELAKLPAAPSEVKLQWSTVATVNVIASILADTIRTVDFAVDYDSCRYAMAAIQVDVDAADSSITLAATDGRRLAYHRVPCEVSITATGDDKIRGCAGMIGRPLCEAIKAAAKQNPEAVLWLDFDRDSATRGISDLRIKVSGAGVHCVNAIDLGRFPAWRQIVPNHSRTVDFDPAGVLALLDRTAKLATSEDGSDIVRVEITAEELTATRLSPAGDVAETFARTDHGGSTWQPFKAWYSAKFLRQWLKANKSKSVTLAIATDRDKNPANESAVKLSTATGNASYVLMPLSPDKIK